MFYLKIKVMMTQSEVSGMLIVTALMFVLFFEAMLMIGMHDKTVMARSCVRVFIYGITFKCSYDALFVPEQNGVWGLKCIAAFAGFMCLLSVYLILRYFDVFSMFLRPFRRLRGIFYALCGATAPCIIAYEDGTFSRKILNKSKKGVVFEYEEKKYIICLHDHLKFFKWGGGFPRECLIVAASENKGLQKTLAMCGGSCLANGSYLCFGNPSLCDEPSIGVKLGWRGKVKKFYSEFELGLGRVRDFDCMG